MELTPERKARIDGLSHYELLERIRHAPAGDGWFMGETGAYWMKTYARKRDEDPAQAVADSKAIGWERCKTT